MKSDLSLNIIVSRGYTNGMGATLGGKWFLTGDSYDYPRELTQVAYAKLIAGLYSKVSL